jgi:hypothetical protein
MSRCIVEGTDLENPKQLIIWGGDSFFFVATNEIWNSHVTGYTSVC